GEDVLARMKKLWEDSGRDSRGVSYHDLVVDRAELAKAAHAAEEKGVTSRALVFVCGCGVEGCAGIDAVEITNDGYEVFWRIAPTALDAAPIEFTFDPAQYAKALKPALAPRALTRTERIVQKRAKAKSRKPVRAAKKAAKAKRAKAGKAKKRR
ncbi:MAG TPA: hypothetical protein VMV18_14435, partial [bacterium]|nr:hypothetical protein [bacterium]